jgi:hypothetical protein
VLEKDGEYHLDWSCKKVLEVRKRGISYIQERRKVNWIGHVFRRNCFLKHVIEGKVEGGIVSEDEEEDVSSY